MKTKLKFQRPVVIPPGHDFDEEGRTTGEREKQEAHAIRSAEPAHLPVTSTWGEPASLGPGLVGSCY